MEGREWMESLQAGSRWWEWESRPSCLRWRNLSEENAMSREYQGESRRKREREQRAKLLDGCCGRCRATELRKVLDVPSG